MVDMRDVAKASRVLSSVVGVTLLTYGIFLLTERMTESPETPASSYTSTMEEDTSPKGKAEAVQNQAEEATQNTQTAFTHLDYLHSEVQTERLKEQISSMNEAYLLDVLYRSQYVSIYAEANQQKELHLFSEGLKETVKLVYVERLSIEDTEFQERYNQVLERMAEVERTLEENG